MRALALLFARPTWYALVWLMRRRGMRSAQLWPTRWMREADAERFRRRHFAQNRFARRIGLPLLIVAYEVLIASFAINVMYQGAMRLIDGGYIRPDSLTHGPAEREPEGG